MPKFGRTSLYNLSTCHPELQLLFNEVIKTFDCKILCGHRDEAAQNDAYLNKKSNAKWGQSKHNTFPSLAVDVIPYPVDWNNIPRFYEFAAFVLNTAMKMGIQIKWGGFFIIKGKKFFDGPHFELIRK